MKSGVSAHAPRKAAAECVSGVLIRDGAVLVEKRRADDDADPGLVLLPGGHVEVGESLESGSEERDARGTRGTSRKCRADSSPILYSVEWRETENTLFSYQGLEGENQVERSRVCLLGIRDQSSRRCHREKDCTQTIEPSLSAIENYRSCAI